MELKQMGLRVKILNKTTFLSLFKSLNKHFPFFLLLFKKSQSGTDHLAGRTVFSGGDFR